jgi:hypothetical protein
LQSSCIMFITDQNQELAELTTNPPAGITVELADEKDIYVWKAVMEGPAGSPYAVSLCPEPTLWIHRLYCKILPLYSAALLWCCQIYYTYQWHYTILSYQQHMLLNISCSAYLKPPITNTTTGRHILSSPYSPSHIPLQTSDRHIYHQDLSSQYQQ